MMPIAGNERMESFWVGRSECVGEEVWRKTKVTMLEEQRKIE